MPFPTHVIVTLDKEGKGVQGQNDGCSKRFFCEKLEEEPWSDAEATLWFVVQRIPLFKEKRMMVKLKNIHDDRESGEFDFNQKA